MASVALSGTIARAVADYTGCLVRECEAVPDPNVAGTFAVRAVVRAYIVGARDRTIFFLIAGVPLARLTVNDLEEVEFTEWPPTVRR